MKWSKSWPVDLGAILWYLGLRRLGELVLRHAPDESDREGIRRWTQAACFVAALVLLTVMILAVVFLELGPCKNSFAPCKE